MQLSLITVVQVIYLRIGEIEFRNSRRSKLNEWIPERLLGSIYQVTYCPNMLAALFLMDVFLKWSRRYLYRWWPEHTSLDRRRLFLHHLSRGVHRSSLRGNVIHQLIVTIQVQERKELLTTTTNTRRISRMKRDESVTSRIGEELKRMREGVERKRNVDCGRYARKSTTNACAGKEKEKLANFPHACYVFYFFVHSCYWKKNIAMTRRRRTHSIYGHTVLYLDDIS